MAGTPGPASGGRWPLQPVWWVVVLLMLLLALLASTALVVASNAQQRIKSLETELVRRQQDSGSQATEARTLARQAEQVAREVGAKMALLEARVAETTLQRSQLEELIQNLSRSRDESVLAEVDAAVRVAMQQAAITGSAEPLVLTLRQADERLARYNQPRLERVRRAVLQDLERTRTAGITDIALLTVRLDDVIRQVDVLPLWAQPARAQALARGGVPRGTAAGPAAVADAGPARRSSPGVAEGLDGASTAASAPRAATADTGQAGPAGQAPATEPGAWAALWARLGLDGLQRLGQQLWQEVRGLVRVSRIDQPEAMLLAPEQGWFLRENLKLRLLNARLALMSRQFDTAQADLRDAQVALERYFDGESQRVQGVQVLVREVTAQARLVNVPRPEATLAAIAALTATAGR